MPSRRLGKEDFYPYDQISLLAPSCMNSTDLGNSEAFAHLEVVAPQPPQRHHLAPRAETRVGASAHRRLPLPRGCGSGPAAVRLRQAAAQPGGRRGVQRAPRTFSKPPQGTPQGPQQVTEAYTRSTQGPQTSMVRLSAQNVLATQCPHTTKSQTFGPNLAVRPVFFCLQPFVNSRFRTIIRFS